MVRPRPRRKSFSADGRLWQAFLFCREVGSPCWRLGFVSGEKTSFYSATLGNRVAYDQHLRHSRPNIRWLPDDSLYAVDPYDYHRHVETRGLGDRSLVRPDGWQIYGDQRLSFRQHGIQKICSSRKERG